MKDLEFLNIHVSDATDLTPLSHLPKLRKLTLRGKQKKIHITLNAPLRNLHTLELECLTPCEKLEVTHFPKLRKVNFTVWSNNDFFTYFVNTEGFGLSSIIEYLFVCGGSHPSGWFHYLHPIFGTWSKLTHFLHGDAHPHWRDFIYTYCTERNVWYPTNEEWYDAHDTFFELD